MISAILMLAWVLKQAEKFALIQKLSSVSRVESTDIPDSLSPSVPMIHHSS